MARILPAGANVNLNLGEDPMDKLLKTIQVASQAQGVMNQATLQRDRRQAIKEESFQTMMLSTLSSMDKASMASISGAEESLTEMKDKFLLENPGMTDKINTLYGTALSTTINPVKEVHTNFNRDKDLILRQIDGLDKKILNLPDTSEEYTSQGIMLDGSNSQFKENFQELSKNISRYKARVGEYNSIMPDLSFEMNETVLNATSVLNSLPKNLIGVFDAVEQGFYSDLLNGRITESTFDAGMEKYYANNQGRVINTTMPLLAAEMKDLYQEKYIPLEEFDRQIKIDVKIKELEDTIKNEKLKGKKANKDEIEGLEDKIQNLKNQGLIPKLSGNQAIIGKKDPTYYDDTNDVYYLEGVPYGTTDEALAALHAQKADIQGDILNKDNAYRGYTYEAEGEQRSYAADLNSDGDWAWNKKEKEFKFKDEDEDKDKVPSMQDSDGDGIPDYIDIDTPGPDTEGTAEEEGMGILPKTIGGIAVTGLAAQYGGAAIDLAKDIYGTTSLSAPQITEILEDASTQKDFNRMSKIDDNISKLEDIIEDEELKGKKGNKGKIKGLKNRIKKLEKDKTFNLKSVKKYSKKFNVSEGKIQQIFKTKNKNKWLDFYKLKSGIASKAGTFMQKGTKYVLPYQLGTAVYQAINPEAGDWETRGVGAATTVASRVVINKVVKNKKAIKKVLLSKIKDKTKKAAAKRLLQWTVGTGGTGGGAAVPLGVLTGGMFLYDLADIGIDVYKWWTADEIEAVEKEIGKKIPKQSE